MVAETSSTVVIDARELEELRRFKDQAHALQAELRDKPLCNHKCEAGHKVINIDPAERERMRKESDALDKQDKLTRLADEDRRLDELIKAGVIDRRQKDTIMAAERDRMGM